MEGEGNDDERTNLNGISATGGRGRGGNTNDVVGSDDDHQVEGTVPPNTSDDDDDDDDDVNVDSSLSGTTNDEQDQHQEKEGQMLFVQKGKVIDKSPPPPPYDHQQARNKEKIDNDDTTYQEMAIMTIANKERILAYTTSSSSSAAAADRSSPSAAESGTDEFVATTPAATIRRSVSERSEAVTDREQVQAVQRRSILMTPGAYAMDPEGLITAGTNEDNAAGASLSSENNDDDNRGGGEQPATTQDPEDPSTTTSDDPEAPTMAIEGAVLVAESEDDDPDVVVDIENPQQSRDDEEVVQGTILPDTTKGSLETKQLMGMAALLILVLILILVPVVVFGGGNNNSSGSSGSNGKNGKGGPFTIYPPFQEELNQETILAIQDPTNAYYHANAWIWNDPNFDNYTPERRYQRFSMAWIYFIWNGNDWYRNDDWLSYDVHECNWYMQNSSYGIDGWHVNDDPSTLQSVCDPEGKIRVLNLTNNNLQGFLPASQTINFPELVIIDLADNNISGFIPSVGEDTKKMIVFNVANNNLEGQLTGGGGFNTFNLRIIRLEGNSLLGYLAGIYWVLPDLQVLDSTGNLFDGVIEPSASMCKNLSHWRIGENLYEGTLPSEIGRMVNLQELVVGGNERLTGTVPSELGLLSNLNLLNISGTGLVGPIPEGLCSRVQEGALDVIANCSLVQCCA